MDSYPGLLFHWCSYLFLCQYHAIKLIFKSRLLPYELLLQDASAIPTGREGSIKTAKIMFSQPKSQETKQESRLHTTWSYKALL
jgi:hypothetical protein